MFQNRPEDSAHPIRSPRIIVPRRPVRGRLLAILTSALAMLGLAFVPLLSTDAMAGAAVQAFSISTNPQIVPSFNSKIHYYAIRSAGHSSTKVVTTGSKPVTVGGKQFQRPVNVSVPLRTGQSLQITYAGVSYYMRCLPSDFPAYSATVPGHPTAEGYLLTLGKYTVAFDNSGVPVWWDTGVGTPSLTEPNYAEFINPSTIAWGTASGSFQFVGLNGRIEHTVGGGPFQFDTHDFEVLPNGDYLGFERVNATANLSSWGKASNSDDHRRCHRRDQSRRARSSGPGARRVTSTSPPRTSTGAISIRT